MKQLFLLILFITGISLAATAQPKGERWQKIREAKKSYITERLNLTPEENTRFWPVYNSYERDLRNLRNRYKQQYRASQKGELNEREAREWIQDNLEYQQEELNIKKEYKNRFLEIISARQMADLYQAERDFKIMLLKRMKESRGNGGRR